MRVPSKRHHKSQGAPKYKQILNRYNGITVMNESLGPSQKRQKKDTLTFLKLQDRLA